MSLVSTPAGLLGAWETKGQVYFGVMESRVAPATPSAPVADGVTRKHPRLAADADGDLLLVWTEASSMVKVGTLAWQKFGRSHLAHDAGSVPAGTPALSFGAPVPRRGGGFTIFH
jgi:hypothetical protein